MKKTLALILGLTLTAGLLSGCVGTRETTTDTEGDSSAETSGGVVNVYNWGEYIDESVLTDFEEATGIKVNYQMYDSNETMYSKVSGGGAEYDVVIPSDYMIARMIEEDAVRLAKVARSAGQKELADRIGRELKEQLQKTVPTIPSE